MGLRRLLKGDLKLSVPYMPAVERDARISGSGLLEQENREEYQSFMLENAERMSIMIMK
jgi:hypothetical protein